LKLRNASKIHEIKVSEKTLEYFLYLFKSREMWAEVIDMSETYHQLAQLTEGDNEVRNYYLSDSLLNMPLE
jgi:hypothetical protein